MRKLLLAFLSLSVLLYSCSNNYSTHKFEPVVNDSLNMIGQQEKQLFLETTFPDGIVPYLITTDSLDKMAPGITADEMFEQVAEQYHEQEAFEKIGFLIIVSRNPLLIQTRAGSDIKMHARWKGITAGQDYLRIQQTAHNDSLNIALTELFSFLEDRLPELSSISWWDKMQYNQAATLIGDEIEEFGLPSESFYSDTFLKPVLKLRIWELNHLGSWWLTYLIAAIVIFLLTKSMGFIIKRIGLRIKNASIQTLVIMALNAILGIYLSIPALSSAVVLSSGRLEDILALQSSGIPFTDYFSTSTASFGMASSIWLIAILAVVRFLKGMSADQELMTMSHLSDEIQQKSFTIIEERNPFTAAMIEGLATKGNYFEEILSREEFLKKPYHYAYSNKLNKEASKAGLWAFLALGFLSKAIVMAAIFLWLLPVIQGYIAHVKAIKKFNINFPQFRIKLSTIFLTPAFLLAVVLIVGIVKKYAVYLLFVLIFILSSGILAVSVVSNFITELNNWQIWLIAIIIPGYYIVRIGIALFQTMEKLKKVFSRYISITVVSFILLALIFYKLPEYDVRRTTITMFPKISEIVSTPQTRQGVITSKVLNVREKADIKSSIVMKLSQKDTFDILNMDEEWWQVKQGEKTGFIYSKYAEELIND